MHYLLGYRTFYREVEKLYINSAKPFKLSASTRVYYISMAIFSVRFMATAVFYAKGCRECYFQLDILMSLIDGFSRFDAIFYLSFGLVPIFFIALHFVVYHV